MSVLKPIFKLASLCYRSAKVNATRSSSSIWHRAANRLRNSKVTAPIFETSAAKPAIDGFERVATKTTETVKKGKIAPNLLTDYFKLKLDKKTKERLLSIDNPETFIQEAHNTICKILGIPPKTAPQIFIVEPAQKLCHAAYVPIFHQIHIKPEIIELLSKNTKGKIQLLSLLLHELEHSKQNLQILATEGLGIKAIEYYSKGHGEIAKAFVNNSYGKLSIAELEKLIQTGKLDDYPFIEMVLKLKKGNKSMEDIFKAVSESATAEATRDFEKLRKDLLSSVEPIYSGTFSEKLANIFYKEITNYQSTNAPREYIQQVLEVFAYIKQFAFNMVNSKVKDRKETVAPLIELIKILYGK